MCVRVRLCVCVHVCKCVFVCVCEIKLLLPAIVFGCVRVHTVGRRLRAQADVIRNVRGHMRAAVCVDMDVHVTTILVVFSCQCLQRRSR